MNGHYVIKLRDMYVGSPVGTYKDDPDKAVVKFYGDINDAVLMDSYKAQEVYDLLSQHFPDLTVVAAHIAEANTQTTLFESEDDEDS